MKKLVLVTTALLLSTSALNASADTFEFDPEQDTVFIDTDVLTTNMFPNDPVVVRQSLSEGASATQLDDGDKFSETVHYNLSTSTGSPNVIFPAPPNGLEFDLVLTGTIANVVYGAGIPTLGDVDFLSDLAATSFDTLFNTSAADASVGMTVTYGAAQVVIGEFDLVAQVNTPNISLDGTTVNQAFILDYRFDQVWAAANLATINNVWREDGGALIDPASFTLQVQGSAGPNGTTAGFGTDVIGNFVNVNVQDNGSTVRSTSVPEPTSLAILGLGLLGLAGARRKA